MPVSWRARMTRSREKAESYGHFAELVALTYLRLKGYHLLAQRFSHLLPDRPRHDIGAAARRKSDYHADRLDRIRLRQRGARQ